MNLSYSYQATVPSDFGTVYAGQMSSFASNHFIFENLVLRPCQTSQHRRLGMSAVCLFIQSSAATGFTAQSHILPHRLKNLL